MDHANTFALLIGSSDFPQDPSIAKIPNVKVNLDFLNKILINTEVVGIPETNITISLNEKKSLIEKKLRDIAFKTRKPENTLLVYYTGHGIMSSEDYQLYLTTHDTSKKDLEIEGINIDEFKKYIKKSYAKRKIVILDCCHSGAIINAMGDMPSKIQSDLNKFEGTYVMTSAAEDTPSLFPVESPDQPTYFTGKLIEILNEGMDVDEKYLSLRDIYNKIETDLTSIGLPPPQQSNFNTADKIDFSLNKKFILRKPDDEVAWEKALSKNNKWEYIDFKKQFPQSSFLSEARNKLVEIYDEEDWIKASYLNSVSSLDDYMDRHPSGRHFADANNRIKELRDKDEEEFWKQVNSKNSINSYQKYIDNYPSGKYKYEAKKQLKYLSLIEQETKIWQLANTEDKIESFQKYLDKYTNGKYSDLAKAQIDRLEKLREEEEFWNKLNHKSIIALKEYLSTYPEGKYYKTAEIEIEVLRRNEEGIKRQKEEQYWNGLDHQSIVALNDYLSRYPVGAYYETAKSEIGVLTKKTEEERFWEKLNAANTIKSFTKYLNTYPEGKFINEARQRIEVLKASEGKTNPPGILITLLIKYWKIITGAAIAMIVIFLVIKFNPEPPPPNPIDDNSKDSVAAKDTTVSSASVADTSLKRQSSTEVPMSAALLDTIKAFSNVTNLRYYNFFDGIVNRIKLAPKTQQDSDYVQKFLKKCRIAKAKAESEN